VEIGLKGPDAPKGLLLKKGPQQPDSYRMERLKKQP
jgi:hypothetical protein